MPDDLVLVWDGTRRAGRTDELLGAYAYGQSSVAGCALAVPSEDLTGPESRSARCRARATAYWQARKSARAPGVPGAVGEAGVASAAHATTAPVWEPSPGGVDPPTGQE